MKTLSYRIVLRLTKMLNVVLMTAPPVLCWTLYYAGVTGITNGILMTYLVIVAFAFLYVTYGRIYDSFLISLLRISEMIYSQCLALLMSDALLYVILPLIAHHLVQIVPMLAVLAAQAFLSILWCVSAHIWYFKKYPAKKTVVIY